MGYKRKLKEFLCGVIMFFFYFHLYFTLMKSIHGYKDNGGMPIVLEIYYFSALLSASIRFSKFFSNFLTACSNFSSIFSNFESKLNEMSKSGFLLVPGVL